MKKAKSTKAVKVVLPDDVYRSFHIFTIKNGETMQGLLSRYILKVVKGGGRKSRKIKTVVG